MFFRIWKWNRAQFNGIPVSGKWKLHGNHLIVISTTSYTSSQLIHGLQMVSICRNCKYMYIVKTKMVNELRKLVWKYVYLIHINIPTKISSHVVSIFGNCLMVCNIVIKVVDEEEIDRKKYLLIAHLYHLGQYVDEQTMFAI